MQVLQPSTSLQQGLTVTGDWDSEWHMRHLKLSKKSLPKSVSVIRRLNDKPSSLVKMIDFFKHSCTAANSSEKIKTLMLSWTNSADLSWRISLAGPLYVHFSFQLIQKYWYTSLNFTHNTHLDVIIHLKKLQRRGEVVMGGYWISFFLKHTVQLTGELGKGESSPLTPRYHYHLLQT